MKARHDLGRQIEEERLRRLLTHQQAAKEIGITRPSFAAFVAGRKPGSLSTAKLMRWLSWSRKRKVPSPSSG